MMEMRKKYTPNKVAIIRRIRIKNYEKLREF